MSGGFHGAAVITLDAKGRVAIPTRHRAALLESAKTLVITAHPEGCVLIYPETEWEPVRARVDTFPSFQPQAAWWATKSTSSPTAPAASCCRRRCASTRAWSATR